MVNSVLARQRKVFLITLLVCIAVTCAEMQLQLVPEFCNSIVFNDVRVSVLTPFVMRLERNPGCTQGAECFEDRPSTAFTNRSPPKAGRACTWAVTSTGLHINTSELVLRYTGGPFNASSLSIRRLHSEGEIWSPGKTDDANLNGTLTSTDCGAFVPLTPWACIGKYQAMMQPGLLSHGFGVWIDDTYTFLFDGDARWPPYGWRVRRRAIHGYSDHMFFGHGRQYRQALADFVQLSGPVQLMPYRSYGVWFSDHQGNLLREADVQSLVNNFTALGLPLNWLVLDEDWHWMGSGPKAGGCVVSNPGIPLSYPCDQGFGGFNWNRDYFADPSEFQKWLHDRNISLMLNVHDQCGIDQCQRGYQEARQAIGWISSGNETVPCEFENAALQQAFYELNLEAGENAGVDAWWTDFGDTARNLSNTTQWADGGGWRCINDTKEIGRGTRDLFTSSTFWTAYVRASRLLKRGKRGMSLGVYGGLGHHRMPLVGSGDTLQAYETLAYEIYMTITSANVAVGWTHDLGGFIPVGDQDPELFLRWLQFGTFSPVFRTHCAGCELRPWKFRNWELLKPVYQWRNALGPYLYSAAAAATTTGVLPLHPLYYNWPAEEDAYVFSEFRSYEDKMNSSAPKIIASLEYAFGPDMVVSPVFEPVGKNGTIIKRVWIPPGQWMRWQTGEVFLGPSVMDQHFSQAEVPVFVRVGAVVPLKTMYEVHEIAPHTLVLQSFLPPQMDGCSASGSTTVYEDDGVSLHYQSSNAYRKMNISNVWDGSSLRMRIVPQVEGAGYAGERTKRQYNIETLGGPSRSNPMSVTINGIQLAQQPQSGQPGWRHASFGPNSIPVLSVSSGGLDAGDIVSVHIEWGATFV